MYQLIIQASRFTPPTLILAVNYAFFQQKTYNFV